MTHRQDRSMFVIQVETQEQEKRRHGGMRRVPQPDQRAEDGKSGSGSAGFVEPTFVESSIGCG